MKITVRRGVFETNSSSTHSLVLCLKDEYEKWKSGEYVYQLYSNKLVPKTPDMIIDDTEANDVFLSYEHYNEYTEYYETYEKTTNVNGTDVIAFGYYGYGC